MKVFALSDLHLTFSVDKPMEKFGAVWDDQAALTVEHCNDLLTDDDLLLIAGDISWAMRKEEAIADLEFIGRLKGKKVLIRGNHDYWWTGPKVVSGLLPASAYAVHNTAVRIGNYVIGGNRGISLNKKGLTKEEIALYPKHYAREMQRFDMSLAAIAKLRQEGDRTILMTHFPPYKEKLSESNELLSKIEDARIDAVVFGHIHSAGFSTLPDRESLTEEKNGVKYYLTSSDLLRHCPIRVLGD